MFAVSSRAVSGSPGRTSPNRPRKNSIGCSRRRGFGPRAATVPATQAERAVSVPRASPRDRSTQTVRSGEEKSLRLRRHLEPTRHVRGGIPSATPARRARERTHEAAREGERRARRREDAGAVRRAPAPDDDLVHALDRRDVATDARVDDEQGGAVAGGDDASIGASEQRRGAGG